jgi:hypothetical protein
MIEKLFIVAAGNEADYRSLQRGLAGEANVAILYDRRRTRSVGAGRQERRRRSVVAVQLQTRGWAVVRISTPDQQEKPRAAGW